MIRVILAVCVIGLGLWVGLPYVNTAAHRADTLAGVQRSIRPTSPPPKQITVYQSVGAKGEPVFSDARGSQPQGKPIVIDNNKGNTFRAPHQPDQDDQDHLTHKHYGKGSDPIAKMQREQLQFQQQGHDLKQAQIERVIGE